MWILTKDTEECGNCSTPVNISVSGTMCPGFCKVVRKKLN